jgi:hypothetical protein
MAETRNARYEEIHKNRCFQPRAQSSLLDAVACGVIVAAIVAVVVARIRLLSVPLERDEGEYAYVGQLMLQGIAPYAVAANMKLPGTYAAYALIMAVFGQTPTGIHIGLLLVNVGCIVLVYLIAGKVIDADSPSRHLSRVGLAAAGTYAALSVGMGVLGVWAHATHFVVLPALGATLLITKWSQGRQPGLLVGSGILYGVAFLMKQPGLLFCLFGFFVVLLKHWSVTESAPAIRRRVVVFLRRLASDLALFTTSVALPFVVTCLLLWRAGVFDSFWFWVVSYGHYYVSMVGISRGVLRFLFNLPLVTKGVWLIWLLAAGGMVLSIVERRASRTFLLAFPVISFAAVCPGLYFRRHYFVLMLPAVAFLVASLVSRPLFEGKWSAAGVISWLVPTGNLWLVGAAISVAIVGQKEYLFESGPADIVHQAYSRGNPFVEAIEIASYIESHSPRNSRIAILGSEPEILFYAHRRSVTAYIYLYAMAEKQPLAARMQNEFIRDIEGSAPDYAVMVNSENSWPIQANAPAHLFDWWKAYEGVNYEAVGLADMLPSATAYYWDAAAKQTTPRSQFYVTVLKRKHW